MAIRDAAAKRGGSPDGMGGEILGHAAFAEAEYGLAHDGPDPSAWAAAAAIWERLERPWMVARCRLGEAEAILAARRSRVDATEPLRAAMAIARRLGAAPAGGSLRQRWAGSPGSIPTAPTTPDRPVGDAARRGAGHARRSTPRSA